MVLEHERLDGVECRVLIKEGAAAGVRTTSTVRTLAAARP